jgi:hypothetical protein
MNMTHPGRLTATLVLIFFSAAANAEVFFCRETASVSIDQFGTSSSTEKSTDFEPQDWIVDTDRGWRRADVPHFSGSCLSNKGYVVCRETNIVFGEASLSIHPDGANFILVYIDYGLDALAFVGRCRQEKQDY